MIRGLCSIPSLNLRSVQPGQKDLLSFMTWSRLFSTSSKFTSSVESVVLDEERESCDWSAKRKTRSKTRHLVDIYSERKGKFQKQERKKTQHLVDISWKWNLCLKSQKENKKQNKTSCWYFLLKKRESFKNKTRHLFDISY